MAGETPPAPPAERSVRVLHFNDVYNVQDDAAARFVSLVREYRQGGAKFDGREPVVLFSGDAFNPSIISVSMRGSQMVPVLNAVGVDVALFGNHDFDFGVEHLADLVDECNFPWLLSNVGYKPEDGAPLANGLVKTVVTAPSGLRVGVMGLVEWEWIATLSAVEEDDLAYEDFVTCAKRIAGELRQEADVVIALTHMRWGNDERLAREVGDQVDLILGGHDHDYEVREVGQVKIVKSGTDFRDLSVLDISHSDGDAGVSVGSVERRSVSADTPVDTDTARVVDSFEEKVMTAMSQKIGECKVDLEGRFSKIRTEETNVANLVADVVRHANRAEVSLINSGTLRMDRVLPAGPVTLGDLRALLPMVDGMVVIKVSGEALLSALENGVSRCELLEGRFPCVSGVRFAFDPSKPAMARVDRASVQVAGEPLDPERMYTLCTKTYLARGKDGYESLEGSEEVQDEECCTNLPTLLRNYFVAVDVVGGIQKMQQSARSETFLKAVCKFHGGCPEGTAARARGRPERMQVKPVVDGRIRKEKAKTEDE